MRDGATSFVVELPHLTRPREGHIFHERKYNTGHGIPAIRDEIRGEIRRELGAGAAANQTVDCWKQVVVHAKLKANFR